MYPGRLEELIATQARKPRLYEQRADPTFVPVVLTGGIGDVILAIPTLRRLADDGYVMHVSTPHAEAFRYFCPDVPVTSAPLPDFTWYLEMDSVSRFSFRKGFAGFQLEEHELLFQKQQRWFRECRDVEQLVNKHPRDKFLLTRWCADRGISALTLPLVCLGFKPDQPEWRRKRAAPDNYITIHDGYDANYRVSGRATKQWEWSSWNRLVAMLKAAYPHLQIIQLGAGTSRPIDGVDKQWIGKTSITGAFDALVNAKLHIDTDSGLVHAATAASVPCVTMFGPTPASFYGHPQNLNVTNAASCGGGCFHLMRNWMDKCPVGYQTPRCMDDITPDQVMLAVNELLK